MATGVVNGRAPCIIGAAARTWHPEYVGERGAPEPLDMWDEVARAAAADSGRDGLLALLESVQIVYCQTCQYDDPVDRLSARVGAEPAHRHYSGIGGTTTQQLVGATAQRMLAGELELALITSAEALATQRACKRRGEQVSYSFRPPEKRPFPWESPPDPIEIAHEVFQAWLTFAVFDNARRARLGTSLDDYRTAIGEMLDPMNARAAANPHAWFRTRRDATEIVTPGPANRMVGYPYTKYMVAVMDVDMAAALIIATHDRADALGIPAERRVYLRGWSSGFDPVLVAAHPDLSRSPAMAAASAEALRGAGATADDVAHFDLYSCFPSSLHFATDALGLEPTDPRGLTVTGGLAYHGGPASGYLTHSIAAMVETLRNDPDALGLVSGVGMHMTKHAFGVYSTRPGPVRVPQEMAAPYELPVVAAHDGDAIVAGYCVVHDRTGDPVRALLVCDLPGGARTYATVTDPDTCTSAELSEVVGRSVSLEPEETDTPAGRTTVNRATVRA